MASLSSVTRSPSFAPKVRGGFALLIVLTLISFLVLLLVGLATYTRIETAVAGNTQRQAQARQNALLGLHVALGQLQQHAGPDQRVTATAEAFPNATGTRHYTGVWPGDSTATATPTIPLTWLVSGNEIVKADGTIDPLAVTPAAAAKSTVELVGRNSSGLAGDVVVPLVDITSAGVPGQAFVAGKPAIAPIGRYGWWVGDQGVKAPVAVPDTSDRVTYAPYGDGTTQNELGKRLRQQIGLGAGAADAGGNPVFEPRDANNAPLVADDKIIAPAQLAFLKNASNSALGLTTVQQNFHTWSPNNFAVLANTKLGGLRQDLSLKPDLLGAAFATWADYAAYMEDFSQTNTVSTPAILPEYGPDSAKPDPLRRRYRILPPFTSNGIIVSAAPVIAFSLLNFDSRTSNGVSGLAPIETRLRWVIALWNPYSSALIPEDLKIEIEGLPQTLEFAASQSDPALASIPLRSMFGSKMVLNLPWDDSRAEVNGRADVRSWLPGRVYYWVSIGNTGEPNNGLFYNKSLIGSPSRVLTRLSSATISGNALGGWRVTSETRLTLRLLRASDDVELARCASPVFPPFFATDNVATPQAKNGGYEFSFFSRLDQNHASGESTWLTTAGRDPRKASLSEEGYVSGSQGPIASAYPDVPPISNDDLLLERSFPASATSNTGQSYNENTPVFELPRGLIVSLGALQHIQIDGARPFAVGNSWGENGGWNRLFDQYFFSGLTASMPAPDIVTGQKLPNRFLMPLRRKADGAVRTVDNILATADSGFSSKHVLLMNAFNLNSLNRDAWVAVLRGVRYQTAEKFTFLDASSGTGTGGDASQSELSPLNAVFFRFSQSAQETYKADDPTQDSTYAASATVPPEPPSSPSQANTQLYRKGMRLLDGAQVVALANAIVTSIREKHSSSGVFRSMDEFLNSLPLFVGSTGKTQSLLEKAIADVGLNSAIPEFSSQWLTQGDIMTALAPVLFPRSDTFVIRSYGEAVNPTTGATEGRAWCEVTVQRVPEYFDKTQPEETASADLNPLNQRYGRRFKVISFRWLTRSDI